MYKKELLYIIKNKGYCYSVDLSSHLSCAVCPISDKCRTLHRVNNNYSDFMYPELYAEAIKIFTTTYGEEELFEVML